MKVGASLNAKGWGMISEDLTMLETATAGADVPQLWSLLEAFFGKVDDNDASVVSASSATGHLLPSDLPNINLLKGMLKPHHIPK